MVVYQADCCWDEWVPLILLAGKSVAVQMGPKLAMMILIQIICFSHLGYARSSWVRLSKDMTKKCTQISFVGIHDRAGEAFTYVTGSRKKLFLFK